MYESHVFILSFPRRWESTFACISALFPLVEGVEGKLYPTHHHPFRDASKSRGVYREYAQYS